MERYRSGHNEAVLKTVCPQGRVGSNPTLSACWKADGDGGFGRGRFYIKIMNLKRFECWFRHLEKYPRWLKGHPWKGCRSLIAARGFKSLLLRLQCKQTLPEPWQPNSNAALKIRKRRFREQSGNRQPKAVKKEELARVSSERRIRKI